MNIGGVRTVPAAAGAEYKASLSRQAAPWTAEAGADQLTLSEAAKALLAKAQGGGPETLTADELDRMQKAGGLVNTMANLSAKERALYDEFVAGGNQAAAQGLRNVALARVGMGGQQVTLPNGQRFDPANTELTGTSVRQLYRFMFADPSGETNRAFDALAAALDARGLR